MDLKPIRNRNRITMAIKKVKTVLGTPKVAKPTKKEITNWPTLNHEGGIPKLDKGVDITPLFRQPFHNKKKNLLRFSKKRK